MFPAWTLYLRTLTLLRRRIGSEWRHAVIGRGVRSGCCQDIGTAQSKLTEDMDDNLFQRILRDKNRILHALLPDRRRSLEYLAVMIENWYLKSTP